MEGHRWARVPISLYLLADILAGKWADTICRSTTAPADLKVIAVYQPLSAMGQWCYVICESSQFAPVPDGAQIPKLEPFEYTTQTKGGAC